MKYKRGDRVYITTLDNEKGTISNIRDDKDGYNYKIKFDNNYLVSAYYLESEIRKVSIDIDVENITNMKDMIDCLRILLNKVNEITDYIDNSK